MKKNLNILTREDDHGTIQRRRVRWGGWDGLSEDGVAFSLRHDGRKQCAAPGSNHRSRISASGEKKLFWFLLFGFRFLPTVRIGLEPNCRLPSLVPVDGEERKTKNPNPNLGTWKSQLRAHKIRSEIRELGCRIREGTCDKAMSPQALVRRPREIPPLISFFFTHYLQGLPPPGRMKMAR